MFFSSSAYTSSLNTVQNKFPQIYNNTSVNVLNSCSDWTIIEGIFTAIGNEEYITIGNFSNDANSFINISSCSYSTAVEQSAYYYIDDVWVIPCDTTTKPPTQPTEQELVIPNVFTPNGDGVNDSFQFSVGSAKSLQFTVYNRWGIALISYPEALEATDGGGNNGSGTSSTSVTTIIWDGRTTSGIECSAGVYFYTLEYVNPNGELKKKNGYISLIR